MSTIETTALRRALTADLDQAAAAANRRLIAAAEQEGLAEVAYASFDSPLGRGYVAATERGVVGVGLPNFDADSFLVRLASGVGPRVLELPGRLDSARRQLDRYFAGELHEFELDLDWSLAGSPFANRVLHETAKLGYGETASYGEVAARAGNPGAHRAAGTALGHNPIPIIVPCHRVLRAGGVLGNYGGGPEMKAWLLRMEGALER